MNIQQGTVVVAIGKQFKLERKRTDQANTSISYFFSSKNQANYQRKKTIPTGEETSKKNMRTQSRKPPFNDQMYVK
jgi:hypothetical protein